MKILIASDIHGSAYYCKKLIELIEKENPEKTFLLGDILYHGPRNALPKDYSPAKTAQMLNDISDELLCIRGNCDSDVDQMVLSFPIMADYAVFYAKNRMIYLTHGHIFDKNNPPKLKKGDFLVAGHTHVPACDDMGDFIYINPGSVSIPKDDSVNGCILLDDDGFKWIDLDGNCYMSFDF